MQYYQVELEKAIVLTLFIPLIMSSGGNSGSQATSLIIRALALREITLGDWWRIASRELPAGLTLGAILGVIGVTRIVLWQRLGLYDYGTYWLLVALTVGLALTAIVTFGSMVGSMLPFLLKRLGVRSGNRLRAVRCHPRRRHRLGDLFFRRLHDAARHASVSGGIEENRSGSARRHRQLHRLSPSGSRKLERIGAHE
jgi:hypothetical protein